ncbi:DUF5696 domain-containing protein [Paenibacillus sp. KS-LC4]|uniref:DUF5696 domain-containing protein n=1 Tax=Paenibacillus sp. KS-LC4 TaxID=2979727 RepID=UPI0030D0E49F
MNIAKKALLITCFLSGMILAGCSATPSGEHREDGNQALPVFTQGKTLSAAFTDSRVAGMKGVAENEQLRLFVEDQTGAIAVLIKHTGEIWNSNPLDRDSDSLATGVNKDLLSSQIKIDFYNSFGQINSINSYTDSVAHKQINVTEIPSGISVSYQFGTSAKTAEDLPQMLSKARFEQLSSRLDKSGKRAFLIAYKEDAEKAVYRRNDSALNGLQLERALAALEKSGYTEAELQEDMTELQFTQEKPAARIFQATIEYTLDEDSLVAKIPVSSIRYPEEYPVNTISLLSFFGAGGKDEGGSLFVPDGSGALIHFNNGKTKYPAYQQPVYGSDQTIDRTENAAREQKVRLPVFGIIRESGAFLGIIEQGAAAATIHADIGGRLNSYNYVYPNFYVINKGTVYLDGNGQQRSLPKFQENPMKSDYTIRYAFLSGKQASYQGMAHYYQQYLEKNNGLLKREADDSKVNTPFYLQLVGSISKQKHFVGIPYRALEPLTTFEQAQIIVEQLQQREINDIKLKYAGWFNNGLDHKVMDHMKVDEEIGGSKGLQQFVAFAQSKGISLYPEVAVLTALTGEGFNESDEASRTLREVPATLYPLDRALNRRDGTKSPSYVISPRLVPGYTDSMLKGIRNFQLGGLALQDLADQLNSDFRKNRQIDRTVSETISGEALGKIRDGNLLMMANGGNAYALAYLSDITNAPLSGSGFKLEDEEIPFYQMVIRGFIEYAGAPYNLSAYTNEKQYVLKNLEYGAGVYFEWIYEPNYKVKDSEYDYLYAVNYKLWLDKASDIYHEVNAVLRSVRNERITAHDKLDEGVFKTVYENGIYVIVNYNRTQVTVEGRTVEAESYITGGERS